MDLTTTCQGIRDSDKKKTLSLHLVKTLHLCILSKPFNAYLHFAFLMYPADQCAP
jgi:hypothetical protein